ncbi:MAG: CDP-diacylglycerol--glycerol-3-phosphate 3-phosphatidyltransferase [Rubricella sp.]
MRWTIPNILTVARVLAAPAVALVYLAFDRPSADWIALAIFIGASATDWLDGWIARRFDQGSAFGKMLDPIADKAMIVTAAAVLMAVYGFVPLLVVPIVLILLREVLVSGLREFLGVIKLDVTRLAKWKTTAQMVAFATLFLAAGAEARALDITYALDPGALEAILSGAIPDTPGLRGAMLLGQWGFLAGLVLLWVAAILTVVTGWDYFRKAMPHLQVREDL